MTRLLPLVPLALAGWSVACTPVAPSMPALPPAEADTCNAARFGDLIGAPVTALETRLYLGPVRVIRPGDAVTMDFSASRLNIALDASDRIVRLSCG